MFVFFQFLFFICALFSIEINLLNYSFIFPSVSETSHQIASSSGLAELVHDENRCRASEETFFALHIVCLEMIATRKRADIISGLKDIKFTGIGIENTFRDILLATALKDVSRQFEARGLALRIC